ncbi:hypothetical protein [Brevundimonas sp.]|uniref:hypothetical protein n=1 Tax=Brevundimonas sp. TaxID=1871086 RepID=UPI002E154015|nr:hypothetical protein [Brevundimonas sp.]
MAETRPPSPRSDVEGDAKLHRNGSWAIFVALLLSALLPEKYTLFTFAWPFGVVATAAYYARFHRIADIERGVLILGGIIVIQAGYSLNERFQLRDAYEEIENLACRSDYAKRAGEGLCEEVYGLLYPEPDSFEYE